MSADLTERELDVLARAFTELGGKSWEPPGGTAQPVIQRMVAAGFLVVVDGRCGFEAMKDAMVRGHRPTFVKDHQCIITSFVEGREIAAELVRIKARLGQLGLFKSMHALDVATTAIGYELAEKAPR